MNDSSRNIIGGITFFLIVIILAVGGFFLTKYLTKDEIEETSTNDVTINYEHKVNKEKEFIYYENENFISMEPDITYKDVIINLDVAETINQTLKSELDEIRNSVKYIKDNELDPNREIMYEDEIYSAKERNYESFEYKNYISLLVKDYEFTCYEGSLLTELRSFVYNTQTGKMILPNDLFELYKINIDIIKEKVRTKLNDSQIVDTETNVELILIDETVNGLDDSKNFALYIDKYGDLYISFIVKTNEVDYNENIKLN